MVLSIRYILYYLLFKSIKLSSYQIVKINRNINEMHFAFFFITEWINNTCVGSLIEKTNMSWSTCKCEEFPFRLPMQQLSQNIYPTFVCNTKLSTEHDATERTFVQEFSNYTLTMFENIIIVHSFNEEFLVKTILLLTYG